MTVRRRLAPAAVLALTSLLATGCPSSTPQEKKSFDAPKMPRVPPAVSMPIDPALQQKAAQQIVEASRSSDPVMRAQALEAMSRTRDPNATSSVQAGLSDPEAIVRFAAAMTAGDLRLTSVRDALARLADSDQNENVRVGTRYALHRIGDTSRSHDLQTLSHSEDPRVRANVALCVGQLGEPTGVRVLRPLLNDPVISVRFAAAEGLWMLHDEQGLKNLVTGTVSPFPDDQIIATLALARPGDPRVKDHIIGKLALDKDNRQYLELQLAAARALGMLGDDSGYGVAYEAAKSKQPLQRSLAAWAMGAIRRPDAQPTLAKLLNDPDAGVRLAAAVAVRQLPLPTNAR